MDLSQWLSQQCEQVFGANLTSVLLLGSAQRSDTTPFSDIDVVVVTKDLPTAGVIGKVTTFMRSLSLQCK